MSAVSLVFPHQLFKNNPALKKGRHVYLVEEWLFFRQYNFHKHKLILHRSSMKFYEAYIKERGFNVTYVETNDANNDIRKLFKTLAEQKISTIHITKVIDNWLEKRISESANKYDIELVWYSSPAFLNTIESVSGYFDKKKIYFQTDFYINQRKQRKLLLDDNDKPIGGKWTYDAENRMKFPKNGDVPSIDFPEENNYLKEAKEYVQQHFNNNIGSIDNPYLFVTTFKEAEKWLNDFLKDRFEKFGHYEDAIVADESILHHSVLSPLINTGLLEPQQVLNEILKYSDKNGIPLNSTEGFIRQLIGWREFIRIVYEREGNKQRTSNFWGFKRKIPDSFWTGTTGIDPIDITIKKVLQTGYCHHIERLMVLGNLMLLCEFDPDEVYNWFMELFIDAYDWVMVPNVYGMTQFADGGLMTTKPYISGSNYLMKMSNYQKGEWQATWDGLFWRFMHVHRDFFLKNPRLGMLVGTFDKMTSEKRNTHLVNAENYLNSL